MMSALKPRPKPRDPAKQDPIVQPAENPEEDALETYERNGEDDARNESPDEPPAPDVATPD